MAIDSGRAILAVYFQFVYTIDLNFTVKIND